MVGAARVGGAVASVSLSRPQMTYVELKPMRITDELRHNYAHLHNYLHIPVIIRTFNLIWLHAAIGGGGELAITCRPVKANLYAILAQEWGTRFVLLSLL